MGASTLQVDFENVHHVNIRLPYQVPTQFLLLIFLNYLNMGEKNLQYTRFYFIYMGIIFLGSYNCHMYVKYLKFSV